MSGSDDEDVLDVKPEEVCKYRDFSVPVLSVNVTLDTGVPPGALVVLDPVTQFLESWPPEERKKVMVAKDSESLHTIWPLINGHSKQESISDAGSQIVAMAKHIAIKLEIPWDPDLRIRMQSANSQVELSEGLAKNISFKMGEVTAYLQVHVLNNPAYDMLLRRL